MSDLEERKEMANQMARERSERLIEEFREHYDEYLTFHPEDKDRKREIFESWAIQKIAGLQIAVETLGISLKNMEDAARVFIEDIQENPAADGNPLN